MQPSNHSCTPAEVPLRDVFAPPAASLEEAGSQLREVNQFGILASEVADETKRKETDGSKLKRMFKHIFKKKKRNTFSPYS